MKLVKLQSQQVPTFYCFAVIEAWSNNVAFVCIAHPTMLRRRTRTTCHVSIVISIIPFYSHPKTQHVVTCCERLHTSANIAQRETTMLAQQCCALLRAFARAFTIFEGHGVMALITYMKKLLDSDWLRKECKNV